MLKVSFGLMDCEDVRGWRADHAAFIMMGFDRAGIVSSPMLVEGG